VRGQVCVPAVLPREKSSQYPLDRRLGRPQIRYGRCREEKILDLPGLNLRLLGVQPVANHNADCAIPDHTLITFIKPEDRRFDSR
jgi:hypothetical protein